jgi:predicted anti-sigma-YlaC factor YlaD
MKIRTAFMGVALGLTLALSSCVVFRLGSIANEVFLGESDYAFAGEALPAFIKVSEIQHSASPNDRDAAVTLASLYLLYGTSFLEGEALFLPYEDYDRRETLIARARALYERSFVLLAPFIEKKTAGFFSMAFQLGPDATNEATQLAISALKPFKKADAPLLYYCSAAIFAGFASNPLDFENAGRVAAAFTLLEKALALDPDYSNGAIQELAFQIYLSLPADLGGSKEKAMAAYDKALAVSGGKSAGLYVSYALSISAPSGDAAGFEEYLRKALALPLDENAEARLLTSLAQRKAAYYLKHSEEYVF